MGNALTQNMASVYLQRRLGDTTEYLGECIDIDSIPSPVNAGIEFIWCKNKRGGFKKKGRRKTPPGNIEFSLVEMEEADASLLIDLHCPFNIYVLWSECGSLGVKKNWDKATAVIGGELTDDTLNNVAHHIDQNELMKELAITAAPPRLDFQRITAGRTAVTLDDPYNALTNPSTVYCGDSCGAWRQETDVIYAVGDGKVAEAAHVAKSADGGNTFAELAADPFGVNINLLAVAVFDVDRNTQRIVVARAGVAATPCAVGISDDDGATWATVTVGNVVLEGATGPRSLWALDSEHIWLCTDSGNVYFSSDGAQSWSLQPAAAASGGLDLNCIHFADEKIGIAVGDTDTVILTDNGGKTWAAGNPTGNGNDILSCWAFDQYRYLVGTVLDATGGLWMTFDATDNWVVKSFTGSTTEDVTDFFFYNSARGFMVSKVGGVSSLHFTFDGGDTWEEMPVPTNAGINAVLMNAINRVAMVGELQAATAYIALAV